MSRQSVRVVLTAVALSLILAACGRASADAPSPSQLPTDPPPASPSQSPADPPAQSQEPTPDEEPVVEPEPQTPTVVRHELPMVGEVTADGVGVREFPDLEAPLVTGRSATDGIEEFPSLRVDAGQKVVVSLGPVVADELSWYYVNAEGNGPIGFTGWIPGEQLARDGDYAKSLDTIDGVGSGGVLEVGAMGGAPMVVTYGVNVPDGNEVCHFSASVVRADGTVVVVSDGEVTGPMFGRAAPPDVDLVQQGDGTMTLTVETDCAFAATIGILGH